MCQGNGLGFLVSVFKKTPEKQGEKKSANEQVRVLLKLPVHRCDPLVASLSAVFRVITSSEIER